MRVQLGELEAESRKRALSTHGAVVSVAPKERACPRCGGPTLVQKSTDHDVVTLAHGAFSANETVRVCSQKCTHPSGQLVTIRSQELSRRVNRGGVHGYDLEVRVGLDRYVHHRQRLEIQHDLETQDDVRISTGQISILSARFLKHLEALHWQKAPAFRNALAADGGYPLHVDATGEDGRGTLCVAYAGWKGWVLGAWKLSTERAELILPRLHEVVKAFGIPRALMRDLGKAVIAAANDLARELDADFPILGCQRHFLSDIGEDLLEVLHGELRDLVRRFRLTTALRTLSRDLGRRLSAQMPTLRGAIGDWIESATNELPGGASGLAVVRCLAQWAMDYGQDGEYGSFPYDRPYLDLYERCRKVRRAADAYLRNKPADASVRRALGRLARVLNPVVSEVPFAIIAAKLSSRAELFDELRTALRIVPKVESSVAPRAITNPSVEQSAAELQDIKQALQALTHSLRDRRPERGPAQDTREAIDLILDHLDRHGDSLWGHVIALPPEAGGGIRIVDRTNNSEEGFFHTMKHGLRRQSGRKILTQDFENLPAAAALAYNLNRPDYVQILCGSLKQLPDAFAALDQQGHIRRLAATATEHAAEESIEIEMLSSSLPRVDRPVIRTMGLGQRIAAAARSRAPHYAVA